MPAAASETYSGAAALDQVEASFTRHTREHRLWEVRRNQEMQRYSGGGYGRGYGYGRGRGYGPPPHARAYGRRDRDRAYYRY